jgi:serine-type D-Ala-D-Ala carboxypeptidase/endopeptidase (penicillin-binding protein 4)
VIARHESEPLSTLLYALGKNSDNFYAEMILKALGAEASGGTGTSAAGAEAVTQWLTAAGAQDPGNRITNGSGLFDANRATAGSIARALSAGWNDPRLGPELVAELAIGGVDGTLRSRFRAGRELRLIRAKTGTLARTVALSGYVLSPSGKSPIAFAILVNGVGGQHTELRRRIDEVVEAIVRRQKG